MRTIVLSLIASFSASAFACPDVSGSYQCVQEDTPSGQPPLNTQFLVFQAPGRDVDNFILISSDVDELSQDGIFLASSDPGYVDPSGEYMGICGADRLEFSATDGWFVISLVGEGNFPAKKMHVKTTLDGSTRKFSCERELPAS